MVASDCVVVMPEWDEIFRNQGHVFTEPHPDIGRIAEIFKKRDATRVLDLGCGTGRHTVYLAKCGFEVHALDSSPNALALTEQWLKDECLTARTSLHRMEAVFPYPDDYFDAVISVQVIHHNRVVQILRTIAETKRILKTGGIVFVTVPVLRIGPVPTEMDWDLNPIEPGTYVPHRGPEAGIPHHYFTVDELCQAFHGFTVLEIFVDATGHRCLLGAKKSVRVTQGRRQGTPAA